MDNNYFFIDEQAGVRKSWDTFLSDLRTTRLFRPYLKEPDYYTVFLQLSLAIVGGYEITLLDNDFTATEVAALAGSPEVEAQRREVDMSGVVPDNKESFLELVRSRGMSCEVTIYTSGTTGLPKKVVHTIDSLSRFVRVTPQNAAAVWGFAYNPTHIAGLQVFLQALMNGNTIIRLFQLPKVQIFEEISRFGITHISATPTFYRLLLPYDGRSYDSVVRITSGGEKFDPKTIEAITNLFPKAKVTNVYASTETGTLFAAKGDLFEVKAEIADKIRIEDDELLIHTSLLGHQVADKQEQWYKSGDLVEVCNQDPLRFRFVSRKTEMINVGGYKVNPTEVETVLRSYAGIVDARVSSKKNSLLGNIVIAEVVTAENTNISEAELREFMQTKLQEFKIPRVIKFAEVLSMTRTGKIKRA